MAMDHTPNITTDTFGPHGGQPAQTATTSSYGHRRTFLKSLDSGKTDLPPRKKPVEKRLRLC
jgi:hypothetical protein